MRKLILPKISLEELKKIVTPDKINTFFDKVEKDKEQADEEFNSAKERVADRLEKQRKLFGKYNSY